MVEWHCRIDDQELGPLTDEKLIKLAVSGNLRPTDLVRKSSGKKWARAMAVKGLFPQEVVEAARQSVAESRGATTEGSDAPTEDPSASTEAWAIAEQIAFSRPRVSPRDLAGMIAIGLSLIVVTGAIGWYLLSGADDPAGALADGSSELPGDVEELVFPTSEVSDIDSEPDEELGTESSTAETVEAPEDQVPAWYQGSQQTSPGMLPNSTPQSESPLAPDDGAMPAYPSLAYPSDASGVTDPAATKKPAPPAGPIAEPERMLPEMAETIPAELPVEDGAKTADGSSTAPTTDRESHLVTDTKKEMFVYHERRNRLLTDWKSDQANVDTLNQQHEGTIAGLRAANGHFRDAKMLLLEVQRKLRDLRRLEGGRRGAQWQVLSQQEKILWTTCQIAMREGNACVAKEGELARRLAEARKKADKSKQEFLRFRPAWMRHCDFVGRHPSAYQKVVIEFCSEWLGTDGGVAIGKDVNGNVGNLLAQNPGGAGDFPEAFLLRGFAHLNLKQTNEALADFNRIVTNGGGGQQSGLDAAIVAHTWLGRGKANGELGNENAAMSDIIKVLKDHPRFGLAYLYRGLTYAKFGRERDAAVDFERAIKFNKQEPYCFREAAWLLAASRTMRDVQRSGQYGQRACELTDWADWRCLDTYAVTHAAAGRFKEAVTWATKAAQAAPDDVRGELDRRRQLYQAEVAPADFKRL